MGDDDADETEHLGGADVEEEHDEEYSPIPVFSMYQDFSRRNLMAWLVARQFLRTIGSRYRTRMDFNLGLLFLVQIVFVALLFSVAVASAAGKTTGSLRITITSPIVVQTFLSASILLVGMGSHILVSSGLNERFLTHKGAISGLLMRLEVNICLLEEADQLLLQEEEPVPVPVPVPGGSNRGSGKGRGGEGDDEDSDGNVGRIDGDGYGDEGVDDDENDSTDPHSPPELVSRPKSSHSQAHSQAHFQDHAASASHNQNLIRRARRVIKVRMKNLEETANSLSQARENITVSDELYPYRVFGITASTGLLSGYISLVFSAISTLIGVYMTAASGGGDTKNKVAN